MVGTYKNYSSSPVIFLKFYLYVEFFSDMHSALKMSELKLILVLQMDPSEIQMWHLKFLH